MHIKLSASFKRLPHNFLVVAVSPFKSKQSIKDHPLKFNCVSNYEINESYKHISIPICSWNVFKD